MPIRKSVFIQTRARACSTDYAMVNDLLLAVNCGEVMHCTSLGMSAAFESAIVAADSFEAKI